MQIRCSRLGITALAYLWRRDQKELFEEMIGNGLVAIIIKVAVMGEDKFNTVINKTNNAIDKI